MSLIVVWFAAHSPLGYILWAIATPNPRTPNNLAEYAVVPIYLLSAGLVCFGALRLVKWIIRTLGEQSSLVEDASGHIGDEESLIMSVGESEPFFSDISFDKNKLFGVGLIALGAIAMAGWFFFIPGVLLVMVGVSLIMDVQLWRR